MNRTQANIFQLLLTQELSVKEIAKKIKKSVSYTSESISSLERRNILKKTRRGNRILVFLQFNQKVLCLKELMRDFNIQSLLSGKKEILLPYLLEKRKVAEIQKETGLSLKEIYNCLNDLLAIGAVMKEKNTYSLNPDKTYLIDYAKILRDEKKYESVEPFAEVIWRRGNKILKKTPKNEKAKGVLTAFSVFPEFGVPIFQHADYYFEPEKPLTLEEIFVHSLRFAGTKSELALAIIFFLKNRKNLDSTKIKRLVKQYGVVDLWLDMLAFLDRRKVENEMFLPFDEFKKKAEPYGIEFKEKVERDRVVSFLEDVGRSLKTSLSAYLIGGGNMMLRNLKTSTKDLDIVVTNKKQFIELKHILDKLGFKSITRIDVSIPSPQTIMEREDMRVDLFTKKVFSVAISKSIKSRCDDERKFNNLRLYLLSLEDIFLLKSITDREGDLEDCSILASQGLDWKIIYDEVMEQEKATGVFISFSVLDTLLILEEKYKIVSPIKRKLNSHCLEKAIILCLKNPRTIREIAELIDTPEYLLMKKLEKLEKEREIRIDRKKKPYRISLQRKK